MHWLELPRKVCAHKLPECADKAGGCRYQGLLCRPFLKKTQPEFGELLRAKQPKVSWITFSALSEGQVLRTVEQQQECCLRLQIHWLGETEQDMDGCPCERALSRYDSGQTRTRRTSFAQPGANTLLLFFFPIPDATFTFPLWFLLGVGSILRGTVPAMHNLQRKARCWVD